MGLTTSTPYYVVSKDSRSNKLIVGDLSSLGKSSLSAGPMSWTKGAAPAIPFYGFVKTRYTAKLAPARIIPIEGQNQISIQFSEPQRDLTPGQAAVIYEQDTMIGGGIITEVL